MIPNSLRLAVLVWIASEIWIFVRERRLTGGRQQDGGTLRVLMIVLAGSAVLGVFVRGWLPQMRMGGGDGVLVAGAFAILAGVLFRSWAVVTLGRHFRRSVTLLDEHRLITGGPYRWLRHPAYTGSLASFAGLGLALHNWASLALLIFAPLAAYLYRIKIEERALAARFGQQWAEYRARRRAIVPFIF